MVLSKIQGWQSGRLKPCFLQPDGRRLTPCSPTETRKDRPVSSTETHASCCQQLGNYKAIVDFLGSKPTLGEGNGTPLQSSCLENPMDGGAWWAAVHGVAKSRRRLSDFSFTFHFSLSCIGEGNGTPLQCSCLENPRDGGAWWAAVSGVAQSRTRLKQLSSSSSRYIYTGLGSDRSEHPGLVWDMEDVSYYLGPATPQRPSCS